MCDISERGNREKTWHIVTKMRRLKQHLDKQDTQKTIRMDKKRTEKQQKKSNLGKGKMDKQESRMCEEMGGEVCKGEKQYGSSDKEEDLKDKKRRTERTPRGKEKRKSTVLTRSKDVKMLIFAKKKFNFKKRKHKKEVLLWMTLESTNVNPTAKSSLKSKWMIAKV